jgi:hypothetical protein
MPDDVSEFFLEPYFLDSKEKKSSASKNQKNQSSTTVMIGERGKKSRVVIFGGCLRPPFSTNEICSYQKASKVFAPKWGPAAAAS